MPKDCDHKAAKQRPWGKISKLFTNFCTPHDFLGRTRWGEQAFQIYKWVRRDEVCKGLMSNEFSENLGLVKHIFQSIHSVLGAFPRRLLNGGNQRF